jgi:type II secretory pathway predicted ATPase ExeA
MSITKRPFEEQQEAEARELRAALENVRHVSRVLHGVDNADDLSIGEICLLCRLLENVEEKLADVIKAAEVSA